MKKILLILLCLPFLFSNCTKLPIGNSDAFIYETYEYSELFQSLENVNTYLREKNVFDSTKISDNNEGFYNETTKENENISDLIDDDNLLTDLETELLSTESADQISFEEFAQNNPLYAVLYPNVNQQNQIQSGPVVGFCAVRDTSVLNIYLNDPEVMKFLPVDVKFAYTVKPYDIDEKFIQLVALRPTKMEGHAIVDASHEINKWTRGCEVSITMNKEGAKKWKRLTSENIGKSLAILLDGFVYSFPTVQSEISGGRFSISGDLTVNEVDDIVKRINGRKVYFKQ